MKANIITTIDIPREEIPQADFVLEVPRFRMQNDVTCDSVLFNQELLLESNATPVDFIRGLISNPWYDSDLKSPIESKIPSWIEGYKRQAEDNRRYHHMLSSKPYGALSIVERALLRDCERDSERQNIMMESYNELVELYKKASLNIRSLFMKQYLNYHESILLSKAFNRNLDWPCPGGKIWLYRGYVVEVQGIFRSDDECALLVREVVMKREKRFDKLAKLATLEERMKKASRREPIPDDVKMFVWQRDQGRCMRCGSQENLEFDHIIPIAKGGSNTERNLQLLCERCNREKSASLGSL